MKPRIPSASLFSWLFSCLFLGATGSDIANASESAIADLADLEYKREVLMYCGISDPDAVRGFLDRQAAIVEGNEMTRQMTLDAASDARQAAYAEWQNRGLGGFRGWCRDEGNDYAAILRGYVIDSGDTEQELAPSNSQQVPRP